MKNLMLMPFVNKKLENVKVNINQSYGEKAVKIYCR